MFKDWLLLNETPHATLSPIISSLLGDIAIIDLRSEDWEAIDPKNAEEVYDVKKRLGLTLMLPPFFGKIPFINKYLIHSGKDPYNYRISNNPPANEDNYINLDTLPLKLHWWDYVIGHDVDDNMTKQPARVREVEKIPIRKHKLYINA